MFEGSVVSGVGVGVPECLFAPLGRFGVNRLGNGVLRRPLVSGVWVGVPECFLASSQSLRIRDGGSFTRCRPVVRCRVGDPMFFGEAARRVRVVSPFDVRCVRAVVCSGVDVWRVLAAAGVYRST